MKITNTKAIIFLSFLLVTISSRGQQESPAQQWAYTSPTFTVLDLIETSSESMLFCGTYSEETSSSIEDMDKAVRFDFELLKLDENGAFIKDTIITNEEYSLVRPYFYGNPCCLSELVDGTPVSFVMYQSDEGNSKLVYYHIDDDLNLTVTGEYDMGNEYEYIIESDLKEKDGSFTLGLFFHNDHVQKGYKLMRINETGELIRERTLYTDIDSTDVDSTGFLQKLTHNIDSTGYILFCEYRQQPVKQYKKIDKDFNITSTIDFTCNPPYLIEGFDGFHYLQNPYNGYVYSCGSAYDPEVAPTPDIWMAKFDLALEKVKLVRCAGTDSYQNDDQGPVVNTVGFTPEKKIYGGGTLGAVYGPYQAYIVCMDENMNKYGELFLTDSRYNVHCIFGTQDEGCIMTCWNYDKKLTEIFKYSFNDFLSIEDAHANGLKTAIAYPNPGNNTLNIRTSLKDAVVEVYDIQGRMVYNRDITENITSVSTESWNSGMYLWRVVREGKECESGKWMKN